MSRVSVSSRTRLCGLERLTVVDDEGIFRLYVKVWYELS